MGTTTIVYGYSSSTEASLEKLAQVASVFEHVLWAALFLSVVYFVVEIFRRFV